MRRDYVDILVGFDVVMLLLDVAMRGVDMRRVAMRRVAMRNGIRVKFRVYMVYAVRHILKSPLSTFVVPPAD